MAKDVIYTFDKTTFVGSIFGEVQSGFNMSLTIDGTKDSLKIIVWSFNGDEILPYTIVYHKNTETWWIVAHDKVERYVNESGFIYTHNLELVGAIELLNARDLTDCGFNANTYTFSQFVKRLFDLSNFEFKGNDLVLSINSALLNKKIDYIKSFSNYTLLSAIREFFDGYNLSADLSFNATFLNNSATITGATLTGFDRAGDFDLTRYDIDDFNDVRESKSIDKNSYGTCVVSNAENVVSSVSKTYPALGTIRPSGTEYEILAQNAIIRLPSDVFELKWLKLCIPFPPLMAEIKIVDYFDRIYNVPAFGLNTYAINPYNYATFVNGFSYLNYIINEQSIDENLPEFYQGYINEYNNKKEEILNFFKKSATITLYNGNQLNPVTGEIVQGSKVPYIPNVTYNAKFINAAHPTLPLIVCDKEMRDTLERPWQAIYWERGKNIINGFNAFETEVGGQGSIVGFNPNNCDLRGETEFMIYEDGQGNYVKIVYRDAANRTLTFRSSQWIVNYIPMSDLKLKVDNDRENRDIHIYNQNGKLTDSVAFSRVLNSYAKEISSDTITRYKTYYRFLGASAGGVPQLGSIVTKGNDYYVINNLSLDFTLNEDDGYYIDAEITMSKYISLKSLMVNPNTNIRDYGIPQNYNVKRKQLYRDYYELDYTPNRVSGYYLPPHYIFRFDNENSGIEDFTAVMKLTYKTSINSSYYWYYQLDTINYYMNKLLIIVCDFNDNNIIGYCNQNVWSGFDINRVYQMQIDSLNTPISYTDENGEVQSFDICFETNEQLTNIYYDYQLNEQGGETYYGSLYNYSVFIPQEIYDGAINSHAIRINANNYNKDAIEVPVFEYSCQIGDNNNVLIGDNILSKHENCVYLFSYITGSNLTQIKAYTNNHISRNGNVLTLANGAMVEYVRALPSPAIDYNHIEIMLYETVSLNASTMIPTSINRIDIPTNTDIAIFKHTYNLETNEEIVELMFIAKNVTSDKLLTAHTLGLAVNYYKVD